MLGEIGKQGKLTDALKARIVGTLSKTELEDLYLPYKPKRRTRATIARERGLEPLAEKILAQEPLAESREALAAPFVGGEVPDVDAAWAGARDIVAETVAERAEVRAALREQALERAASSSARRSRARRRRARSSRTTSTFASRRRSCRRIGCWRCAAARRRASCASRSRSTATAARIWCATR